MKKSILKSKTFWVNLLSIIISTSGAVPIDPETAAVVVGCANIALRTITKDPIKVM